MKSFLTLCIGCLYQWVCAQAPQQQLDSLLKDLNRRHLINGSVLAAEQGKVIYQQAFGWRDQAHGRPNQTTTNFELASVSKVFTAVAIMQLEEQHLLALDGPVKRYLPDFPYPAITIRQLLSHTSGLPDFDLFDADYSASPRRIMTNRDIIPALKKWGKLEKSPGQQWQYSSPGMGLLALVVETLSHRPFQQYLSEQIYKKAGMTATYTLVLGSVKNDTNRAIPYAYPYYFSTDFALADTMARHQKFLHQSGGVEGPGLIVSNTTDLWRFTESLFTGRLLKPVTLAKMLTPQKLADGQLATARHYPGKVYFGLGWFILPDSSAGKLVFHSGFKPGTSTMLLLNVTKRQTVVLLDNGLGAPVTAMNAMRLLNHQPTDEIRTPVTIPYGRELLRTGADAALIQLEAFRSDTLHYTMAVQDWIAMGYEFFRTGHQSEALATFRTGFVLYPTSDFLCILYGDVLAKVGRRVEAAALYQRALRLNPKNTEASGRLEKLKSE
ncbi:serine hydrolase domain-containing protein [Spirosoma aerolatum]|uniref:serine hydrolase domain-containing protein n=1 Tax=Spirosoma aerolatum TaxID=1211326 RepID=UPI0009AD4014|nr:serine hydrolase domain-containing protein [Spirosoma aerolatum]